MINYDIIAQNEKAKQSKHRFFYLHRVQGRWCYLDNSTLLWKGLTGEKGIILMKLMDGVDGDVEVRFSIDPLII